VWYRSDDGELWADAGRRYADGIKVGWRKPSGTTLSVAGRRLDGDAPPLEAEIPDGYAGTFQASGLIFPTGGCWEVEAQAGESTLTFVNYVYPRAFKPPEGQIACEQLPEMIAASTLIFTGVVEGDYPVPGDAFLWQTLRVEQSWEGALRRGERIDLLSDIYYGTALERGETYLIFARADAGYHLRALCPVARLDGETITVDIEWGALQTGQRLDEIAEAIEAAKVD
jgi:hypothetical protein